MKITFLGTGTSAGIPLLACKCDICISTDIKDKRLRSSIFIEYKGKNILIDIGPDFRQQMLREDISKIDSILITHAHNDHIGGFDEIRAYNYFSKKTMDVYADKIAEASIRKHYDYIFKPEKYVGIADVNLITIKNDIFKIGNIDIIPIKILHHKLPITAFRIGNFAYVTDIKTISDDEFEKLKGVKHLILSAVRNAEHFSHFNYDEALAFIKKLNVQKAYLTHLSHRFDKHLDLEKRLPKHISVAYDGLKFYCK